MDLTHEIERHRRQKIKAKPPLSLACGSAISMAFVVLASNKACISVVEWRPCRSCHFGDRVGWHGSCLAGPLRFDGVVVPITLDVVCV